MLHKWKDFVWTEECDRAFEELKKYLAHALTYPDLKKKRSCMPMHVTFMTYAINLVLVRTEEGMKKPIYYVSKSHQEAETQFLPLKKVILVIIHAMKKLPDCF